MTDELATLWSLHGLDERLVELREALGRYPEQRRSIEASLGAARERLAALDRKHAELQLKHRQLEKDIEALAGEERKFQGQLPLVKKNEEYSALLHEIAGARAKRSDRETELLLMMEDEQTLEGQRPDLKRALASLEAEAAQRLGALEAEERTRRDEADRVEAERRSRTEGLSPPTRARYERIRTSLEGRAVVPILKGACGGCYRGQPPQVLQAARRADRVLMCDGCGRMLIWPPETAGSV